MLRSAGMIFNGVEGSGDMNRRQAPVPCYHSHIAGVAIRKGKMFPRVVSGIDVPPWIERCRY